MNKNDVPDFLKMANGLKSSIRVHARKYCLEWFDNSFHNQGFTDASFKAWDKRKEPDKRPGGAVLIDTTFLKKSLSVLEETENKISFGTHVPYASVHNFGERVRAIQNVRGFHRTKDGKRQQVKPHTRKIDFKMPQRQFIGESQLMMKGLDEYLMNEIKKRFKEL